MRLREPRRPLFPRGRALAGRDRHARKGVVARRARQGARAAALGPGDPRRARHRPRDHASHGARSVPPPRARGAACARHAGDGVAARRSRALQRLHRHTARGDARQRSHRARWRAPQARFSGRAALSQRALLSALLARGTRQGDARRTTARGGRRSSRQSRVARRALRALPGRFARRRATPARAGALSLRPHFRNAGHREDRRHHRGGLVKDLLRGRKVICCVGSGGVGKTTTAAALALRAAMDGKRTLVLTIDPARRLANSLGLKELGNEETLVGQEHFAQAGLSPRGEMWAMMLDLKHTWDGLVRDQARTPQQAEAILANKLYQTLSTAMAGSLEYMAMEKVYEVYNSKRFDVVVLDTPPTSNALDFLHAADRILDVLDNNAMKLV